MAKKRKEIEKQDNINNISGKNMDEKDSKGKYIVIYTFMTIMLIALVSLVFIILKDKFYLVYKNPIATIELEDLGEIKIELYPAKAPNTVNHFVKLAQFGFYDNKIVYGRDAVSLHFGRESMGGVPKTKTSMIDENIEENSEQDFEYEIDGEFEKNSFKSNNIKHEKYVVSLTRADYTDIIPALQQQSYNTGSSMFKILFEDAPGMNGNYAAFGKVIEGFEIIDELADRNIVIDVETEEDKEELNEFVEFVKIKSVNVETFGNKFNDLKLHKKFSIEDFILQIYETKI